MTGPRKYRFTPIHTERIRSVPPAIVSLIKTVLLTVPQQCCPKSHGTAGRRVCMLQRRETRWGSRFVLRGLGRVALAAVDVRRERTDEREVAVLLGVVEAVADDELVRDVEADPLHLDAD